MFNFVTLIDNARYILTDSFHGMAFSLNLNKEPVCLRPKTYPGRIIDFLKLVGAQDRMIKDNQDFDVLTRPIDFGQVNRVLDGERKRVDEFLSGVFNVSAEESAVSGRETTCL